MLMQDTLGLREDIFCQRYYLWSSEDSSCILLPKPYSQVLQWSEDVVPTVAFNFRKIRKGNVTMKVWDVAGQLSSYIFDNILLNAPGQPKFRSMWERYCNGVDAIV